MPRENTMLGLLPSKRSAGGQQKQWLEDLTMWSDFACLWYKIESTIKTSFIKASKLLPKYGKHHIRNYARITDFPYPRLSFPRTKGPYGELSFLGNFRSRRTNAPGNFRTRQLLFPYLCALVYADLPGRRSLRSAGSDRLVVPQVQLSTVGSRAFPVAAAKLWNSLPDNIISVDSLATFRRQLKHYLFQKSYPDIIL